MDSKAFQAARGYFAASARYWRAAQRGEDMETPTQELLGKSLLYSSALKACSGVEERLHFLRRELQVVTDRYARRRSA